MAKILFNCLKGVFSDIIIRNTVACNMVYVGGVLILILLAGCTPNKRIEEKEDVPYQIAHKKEGDVAPVKRLEESDVIERPARRASSKMQTVQKSEHRQMEAITEALQGFGGHYKIGKPYKIDGTWYFPREDWNYDEVGMGSWYGEDLHGKRTANGEVFDMDKISAAHRILPLPCLVRVTNMENGLSTIVRVNDRGPFANDRIIDLSKATARVLRFQKYGSATVRVQILAKESKMLKEKMLRKKKNTQSQQAIREEEIDSSYKDKVKDFFKKLIEPDEEEDAALQVGNARIQVASFVHIEDAQRLAYKVRSSLKVNTVVLQEERRRKEVYNVVIEGLSDTKAQKVIGQLKKKFRIKDAYVIGKKK